MHSKVSQGKLHDGEEFTIKRSLLDTLFTLLLTCGFSYAVIVMISQYDQEQVSPLFWTILFVFCFAIGVLVTAVLTIKGLFGKEIFSLRQFEFIYQQHIFRRGKAYRFNKGELKSIELVDISKTKYKSHKKSGKGSIYRLILQGKGKSIHVAYGVKTKDAERIKLAIEKWNMM